MARDQVAVKEFLTGKSDEIIVTAYNPNRVIWRQKVFRSDNAHAKTLAIILAHEEPIDLLTGQRIDVKKSLAWTNAKGCATKKVLMLRTGLSSSRQTFLIRCGIARR